MTKPLYNLDPITHEVTELLYADPQYVNKLHQFLTSSIEPPYSLSVNGNWGSGKTTLMKALQKMFERDGYPVLWFNPWEYERTDNIAFSFLVELSRLATSQFKDNLTEVGIFGATLFASGMDLVGRLLTKGALTHENIRKIEQQVREAVKDRYDAENPVEIVKKDFAALTQALAKKHDGNPLIVFFDDLDRCLPDNALDLLEALKNLFIVPNAKVIFISGLDTQVAKQFIIKRYEGLESDFAYNYFKKIFNFTVNVPVLTQAHFKRLIEKRLDELTEGAGDLLNLDAAVKKDLPEYLAERLIEAGVKSIREAYNILHNCWFTFHMDPNLQKSYRQYILLYTMKECFPDFFEECCKLANKNPQGDFLATLQSSKETEQETQSPFLRELLNELRQLGSSSSVLRNEALLNI